MYWIGDKEITENLPEIGSGCDFGGECDETEEKCDDSEDEYWEEENEVDDDCETETKETKHKMNIEKF